MGLLAKIREWKNRITDPLFDMEDDWEQVDAWNEVVYDREDLRISDKKSREDYVRGCLEQIAEASREVDALQVEYDSVTSSLKDMEEIEALPPEEMELVRDYAKKIDSLKEEQTGYLKRTSHMDEEKYKRMERMESQLSEAFDKLRETEKYQGMIKKDLKRLENEKQAYYIRKNDLRQTIDDCRSISLVCAVAVAVCILILLILQYAFGLNVQIGYLATVLAGAIGITMIFIKNNDSRSELKTVENGLTRLISLQNTVKIRYVNNTNLLDYLYVKYQTKSSEELGKDYEEFREERDQRLKYERAEAALDDCEKAFIHELRRYQVKDPMIWLHQTEAILDKREMVEIRHKLIIQRQSLRRRMEYNKEVVAQNAQNEIKDLVEKYPKYAREILAIVNEYEQDYK